MADEWFDLVDPDTNRVIGRAPRELCHGDPSLVHRAVHGAVFHPDGRILLQKRALTKRVQPGRWDMSVGGHLISGEDWSDALLRETEEELGVKVSFSSFRFRFEIQERNDFESENIRVYSVTYSGPFHFQSEEIDEIRFFDLRELADRIARRDAEDLTPLLRREIPLLLAGDAE